MKPRVKPNGKPAQPPSKQRRVVRDLAAMGHSQDLIAQIVGVDRNVLRGRYALDLHCGRQRRATEKTAATAVSKKERERIALIEQALASHWTDEEHGCLLYGGARTVAEALEWLNGLNGGKWE